MWDHKQARTFVHPTRSQPKLVNDTCPGTGGCRNQSAAKRLFADLEMKDVLWMNPEQVGKRWIKVLCSQTEFYEEHGDQRFMEKGWEGEFFHVLLRAIPHWCQSRERKGIFEEQMLSDMGQVSFTFTQREPVGGKVHATHSTCSLQSSLQPNFPGSVQISVKVAHAHPSPQCKVSQVTCCVTGECSVFLKEKATS